eukprot:8443200-Pyramimonas_sp.AAC.1
MAVIVIMIAIRITTTTTTTIATTLAIPIATIASAKIMATIRETASYCNRPEEMFAQHLACRAAHNGTFLGRENDSNMSSLPIHRGNVIAAAFMRTTATTTTTTTTI